MHIALQFVYMYLKMGVDGLSTSAIKESGLRSSLQEPEKEPNAVYCSVDRS